MPKLASLAALGLLVATALGGALWLASYRGVGQELTCFPSDRRSVYIRSRAGMIHITAIDCWRPGDVSSDPFWRMMDDVPAERLDRQEGWGVHRRRGKVEQVWSLRLGHLFCMVQVELGLSFIIRVLDVQHWVIVAGLAALGAPFWLVTARRMRRTRRRQAGFCRTCGYDLRASRQRCPECGTPFGDAGQAPSGDGTEDHAG